ncbi:MAG: hypothetical protein ACP8RL_01865 [cyanobacterium endosymbiont of Rhopalodia inflata]
MVLKRLFSAPVPLLKIEQLQVLIELIVETWGKMSILKNFIPDPNWIDTRTYIH